MPFTIQQIRETPGGPRVETFPSCTYGLIELQAVAGGVVYVSKGTNVFVASIQWNISPRCIMSYIIWPSMAPGGSLGIELSHDGTAYAPTWNWPLIGQTYNENSGIELHGIAARIALYNADLVNVNQFLGSIILKGN